MIQVLSNVKTGVLELNEVPLPTLATGFLRVRTASSLISAGTERILVELAKMGYLGKARARPDLVRQVIRKAQTEGLASTLRNVRSRLERPLPLGYSAAGIVEAVGDGVESFRAGDHVAMAGAGYANHAEVNVVPKNLVAPIPKGVAFEEAAYATVAAVALQGVRLAKPELGDNAVVIGLGLIGLITVQLLKANGCRVLGIELDLKKANLARKLGADEAITDDAERAVQRFTNGHGADVVFIAAATKTNGPIEQAGALARRKAQVVVVGAVGMDVPRDLYYRKELELKVSMSYGPGRYDPTYEEGGVDYPYEYVRWTEQRNLEAVLELMARGKLDVRALTTHRFPIDQALEAYELIQQREEPFVGILLTYDVSRPQQARLSLDGQKDFQHSHEETNQLGVGFVGAGNYASVHLLPHLKADSSVLLTGLVTATGPSARRKGEKFDFNFASTELDDLLEDESTEAVFLATRHATHAEFVVRALEAGKHVFVEKPLVVNETQLDAVRAAYETANSEKPTGLMVGLNRRFSPFVKEIKDMFASTGPKQLLYRVNSGAIPVDSWLRIEEEGGGMLVGEMCHFLDLMRYVTGERAVRVYAQALRLGTKSHADLDNLSVVVTFGDGSVGTLCYSTIGDRASSKERLEIYGGGIVAILDDFRRLEIIRNGKWTRRKTRNQNKGQAAQIAAVVESFRLRGEAPIPFEELEEVMRLVFAARRSAIEGVPVEMMIQTQVGDA